MQIYNFRPFIIASLVAVIVGWHFLANDSVQATQGTCSSHSGVSCSAGPDSDGSAVCNDGWRDSSEWYYGVDLCRPICLSPVKNGCATEQDLENLKQDYAARGLVFSGMYNNAVSECHQQIDDYNRQVVEYDECYGRLIQWYSDADTSRQKVLSNLPTEKKYSCPVNSSYDTSRAVCVCTTGYVVYSNQCVLGDIYCANNFGIRSKYNTANKSCECLDGFKFNASITSCEKIAPTCPDMINGYVGNDEKCYCHQGFEWNSLENRCTEIRTSVNALSNPITEKEIKLVSAVDKLLVRRLAGRILLQVEEHGAAWYVDPETQAKYYMKDGPTAYEMMRSFGLGIKDTDLSQIPAEGSNVTGNISLINRLKGKILLQVEQHGEAWYVNPVDGKRYYLKNGDEAYRIMRILSLGITNVDIRKIPVGSVQDIIK